MDIRGALGSKTGKNAVLPWFWKIKRGGSDGAPPFYGGHSLLNGGSPYYTFWPEKSKIWSIEVKKSNLFIFLQQKIIVTFSWKNFICKGFLTVILS